MANLIDDINSRSDQLDNLKECIDWCEVMCITKDQVALIKSIPTKELNSDLIATIERAYSLHRYFYDLSMTRRSNLANEAVKFNEQKKMHNAYKNHY